VAVVAVVLTVFGALFAGIPAHVEELLLLFVSAEYAVAPKPPTPTTRYPHRPFASAVGVVCEPVCAAKVLLPLASVVVASLSANVRVYPVVLFVLTVTVSLALLTAPVLVGVSDILTEPGVLTLITEAIVTVIVVLSELDAADTIATDENASRKELNPPPISAPRLRHTPILSAPPDYFVVAVYVTVSV
jgi:hypothetical protein